MLSEQLDVKVLLKQVYLAHSTKIKGLEDGIEDLKSKLAHAERKLKNNESDCKRCAELEEAFKSCQAALHEQSKWFENLGQKFSVFDHPESKVESNKIIKETSNASKIKGGISDTLLSSFMPEKSSNVKQNLLKNLMSLSSEEYHDSLDLCTAPFLSRFAQDYSTLNSDSMILAPDTMDIVCDIPLENKAKDSATNIERNNAKVNQQNKTLQENIEKSKQVHNAVEIKECQLSNKLGKKRSLTGSAGSDSNSKKLHKSCENKSNSSPERKNYRQASKSVASESISVDARSLKEKKSPSEGKSREVKNIKTLIPDISNSKSTHCNDTNKNIPGLTNEISKAERNISHKSTESTKDCLSSNVSTSVKSTMYQVSPSLLPLNDKILPVKLLNNEDIYDFQTPLVSKKQHSEEDSSWTACDKKKLKKHALSLKLKSTSKFKMSLDALPPDYKKPTYRQTKLSKSIFLPKSSNANTCEENPSVSSADYFLTQKDNTGFNNVKGNGKAGTVDFDATCIPDNYEYQIIPSGSGTKGKVLHDESTNKEDVIVVNDESIDESLDESSLIIKENYGNKSESKCYNIEKDTFEDFLQDGRQTLDRSENMNSFDRLPKKKEPNYKYKEETVRKKAERKQLNAFDCKECEKYYAELGLSDKEKNERMKQCSRHRSKFAPPATPEHFWELEFPDTQECKARGYMNETQKGKLKSYRRKPL